jgi:hypothetical protein
MMLFQIVPKIIYVVYIRSECTIVDQENSTTLFSLSKSRCAREGIQERSQRDQPEEGAYFSIWGNPVRGSTPCCRRDMFGFK